jgi:hypothetical protein
MTNIDKHYPLFRALDSTQDLYTLGKTRANYAETLKTATHSTKDTTNTSTEHAEQPLQMHRIRVYR